MLLLLLLLLSAWEKEVDERERSGAVAAAVAVAIVCSSSDHLSLLSRLSIFRLFSELSSRLPLFSDLVAVA